MSGRFLVYFADPMCSWCYGFGPELDEFLGERPGLRVDLVMAACARTTPRRRALRFAR